MKEGVKDHGSNVERIHNLVFIGNCIGRFNMDCPRGKL